MKKLTFDLHGASLTELSIEEKQQVTGGSAITYWAGYFFGATVGVLVDFVAAGTLAVQLLSNDPTDPRMGQEFI